MRDLLFKELGLATVGERHCFRLFVELFKASRMGERNKRAQANRPNSALNRALLIAAGRSREDRFKQVRRAKFGKRVGEAALAALKAALFALHRIRRIVVDDLAGGATQEL